MSRYANVYTKIWRSNSFRSLSEDGRTLFMYLLTSPHMNMIGYYYLTDEYAKSDLQWSLERLLATFEETAQAGMAIFDRSHSVVLVSKKLKWTPLEGIKQFAGAVNALKDVPPSPLLGEFADSVKKYAPNRALLSAVEEALQYPTDTVSKGHRDGIDTVPEAGEAKSGKASKRGIDTVSIPVSVSVPVSETVAVAVRPGTRGMPLPSDADSDLDLQRIEAAYWKAKGRAGSSSKDLGYMLQAYKTWGADLTLRAVAKGSEGKEPGEVKSFAYFLPILEELAKGHREVAAAGPPPNPNRDEIAGLKKRFAEMGAPESDNPAESRGRT
ncbi:MAG: hypothetical protein ACYC9Q_14910 [Bacillota bacterium]